MNGLRVAFRSPVFILCAYCVPVFLKSISSSFSDAACCIDGNT
jgi:hypothetical protein